MFFQTSLALGRRGCLFVGVIVALAGVAVAAPALAATPTYPTVMTQAQLRAFALAVHHTVYWAGPLAGLGYSYEVTQTKEGRIFIRYLPAGVKVGDRRSSFLVVATYPVKKAFEATQAAAKRLGIPPVSLGQSGTGFLSNPPTSFYFAYQQANFQVEVYSPRTGRANQLAVTGKIVPIT